VWVCGGRERLKMKFKCRFVVWVSENDEDEDEPREVVGS
jgi:hypothetical protein